MKITLKDVIKEVERELKTRMQVYPRLIQNKKLHRDRANKQYKALELALKLLKDKNEQQVGKQGKMF